MVFFLQWREVIHNCFSHSLPSDRNKYSLMSLYTERAISKSIDGNIKQHENSKISKKTEQKALMFTRRWTWKSRIPSANCIKKTLMIVQCLFFQRGEGYPQLESTKTFPKVAGANYFGSLTLIYVEYIYIFCQGLHI